MNAIREVGIHVGLVLAAFVFAIVAFVLGMLVVIVSFALLAWLMGESL